MKLDSNLDLLLSALILAFAIPAWVPMAWRRGLRPKLWKPALFATLSLLVGFAFANSITFGPFTLDYSLRFAAVGIPLALLALLVAYKQRLGFAAMGAVVSCALSLAMWLFFITLH